MMTYTIRIASAVLLMFFWAYSLAAAANKPTDVEIKAKIKAEAAKLRQQFIKKGQTYEKKDDLTSAARQYKLALTVVPKDPEAVQSLRRVESTMRKKSDVHYKNGLKLYAQGKYRNGQMEFLMALKLWPKHNGALKQLRRSSKRRTTRFALHTVESGETLATIAKTYYGDLKKHIRIAQFNNLADSTSIRPGQQLRIPFPELGGKAATASMWEKRWVAHSRIEPQSPTETVESQMTNYRDAGLDLMRENKYEDAVFEFRKVLNVDPEDDQTLQYLCEALYQNAQILAQKKQYRRSKTRFQECISYRKLCSKCVDTINQCETSFKEMLYTRGIQLFEEQKPQAALKEWQAVKALDPDYKQVNQYIQKARKISTRIDKLKKKKGH